MKIKAIIVGGICAFLSHTAYAKNVCSNPAVIQEAKEQLARSFNYDSSDGMNLTNVEAHTLSDGTAVCTGKLTTPYLETISVWQAQKMSGVAEVSLVQAVDPNHFQTTPLYEQMKKQKDEANKLADQKHMAEWEKQHQQPPAPRNLGEALGSVVDGLFH